MIDHRFYVGPIGGLVPLPDVLTDTDATQTLLGGRHNGLEGGGVTDVRRIKGTWGWAWDGLLERQTLFVESLHNGLVPGPLRLVDPRRRNRLPVQFASGGSQRRSPAGAAALSSKSGSPVASTVAHRPLASIPADPTSLPMARALRGAFAWSVDVRGGGRLGVSRAATVGPASLRADDPWRVPLLLDAAGNAETIVLSCWACIDPTIVPAPVLDSTDGASGGPLFNSTVEVTLTREDRDRTGTATTVAAKRSKVLSALAWTPLTWTFTPKRGMVDSTPLLLIGDANPGCTVYTTAWSWQVAGAEELPPQVSALCPIPDPTAGWQIGGGAPEVELSGIGAHGYGLPGLHKLALSLVET